MVRECCVLVCDDCEASLWEGGRLVCYHSDSDACLGLMGDADSKECLPTVFCMSRANSGAGPVTFQRE
eukprot:1739334-Rhodomonas_salina.1